MAQRNLFFSPPGQEMYSEKNYPHLNLASPKNDGASISGGIGRIVIGWGGHLQVLIKRFAIAKTGHCKEN